MFDINILINALNNCLTNKNRKILNPYIYPPIIKSQENQFLIFLKPEITSFHQGVQTDKALKILLKLCDLHEVFLNACSIIPDNINKAKRLIQKNYSNLHAISFNGINSNHPNIINIILKYFPDIPKKRIFGGHQFLKNHNISHKDLDILVQNSITKKLGHGIYANKILIDRKSFIILNGFYPSQLQHLQQEKSCIIAFSCLSNKSWKYIRTNFIGNIHPERSAINSFRREIYENQQYLCLKAVNIARNCIHISPGPIEAVSQLQLFFEHQPNFKIENTNFYKQLSNQIKYNSAPVFTNIYLDNINIKAKLYEVTEDMDTKESISFLLLHNLILTSE